MKILILSTFIEDFVERASFKIRLLTAKKMAEREHDVTFISPAKDQRINPRITITGNLEKISTPGLFPVKFRVGGFSLLDALYKTVHVLKSSFDVIQVTNGHRPAQLLPCLVGKYLKKAVIVDERWEWLGKGGYADIKKGFVGKIVSLYDRFLDLRVKIFYDYIITISKTLQDRFGNGSNVIVLYGGTENTSLKDYDLKTARKELGLNIDSIILGMSNIGPLDLYNIDIFLRAFEKLSPEFRSLFLLLTGSDKDFVEHIKRRYSFPDRIIFPGWVDFEVYNKYLSACNIFVLPYRNLPMFAAAWPNKLGDYLCLNRPIISNPTGDIKYFFEKYQVGFLCDESPESFYEMIKSILSSYSNLTSYCKDSLYVANEILSFDKRIDKLLGIFQTKLKKGTRINI